MNVILCRVRQTASAIAGHHAQEAAKRKIEELATATVRLAPTFVFVENVRPLYFRCYCFMVDRVDVCVLPVSVVVVSRTVDASFYCPRLPLAGYLIEENRNYGYAGFEG